MNDEASKDQTVFVQNEPLPAWRGSPWNPAIASLFFGDVSDVAHLLECGHPIPIELAQVLALALRADKRVPFRLELVANPKAGGKRPGRWPERHGFRDIDLAAQMLRHIEAGATYEDAACRVANANGVSERLVKKAYSEKKKVAPEWSAYQRDLAAELERRRASPLDDAPPEPFASWMLQPESGSDNESN